MKIRSRIDAWIESHGKFCEGHGCWYELDDEGEPVGDAFDSDEDLYIHLTQKIVEHPGLLFSQQVT